MKRAGVKVYISFYELVLVHYIPWILILRLTNELSGPKQGDGKEH